MVFKNFKKSIKALIHKSLQRNKESFNNLKNIVSQRLGLDQREIYAFENAPRHVHVLTSWTAQHAEKSH